MKSFTRLRIDTRSLAHSFGHWRGPTAIALLGIALSIGAFQWLRYREHVAQSAAFARRAQSLSALIQRGFEMPLEAVRTLPELFAASERVTRDEFIAFVTPILRRHPTVSYIEWAPLVHDQERDAFEQHARDSDWPGFEIVEPSDNGKVNRAPRRASYMPLLHAVTLDPVRPLIGLDLSFSADRQQRNDHALNGNSIDISPRFSLVEDPPGVGSIAILIPSLVQRNVSVDPRVPRRGLAVLIFRLEATIRSALPAGVLDDVDLAVIDEAGNDDSERLLFESRPGIAQAEFRDTDQTWQGDFLFRSRRWSMRFIERVPARSSTLSLVVLGLGIAISIASALALSLLGTVRGLRRQALVAKQLGQYRLTRKIGEGGMGTVYAAEHALLRRPTAIKVLSDRSFGSEGIARFEREVQITSQMTHPNTISIYDFGHSSDGVFYYAMEYVDGLTIEHLVREAGPLPPARVVHLLRQVCGSLREAHAAGLVHRDIKPSNIMVSQRGGISDFVKVLDFGLVKQVTQLTEGQVSGAGRMLGTPQYMPPEALLREGPVEPTVDIYAIGCVAYFMLTSTEVFRAETVAAVVAHHLNETPELPSARLNSVRGDASTTQITPALERVVMQCLAKKASDRPPSVAALADALQASLDGAVWSEEDAAAYWREARRSRDTCAQSQTTSERSADTLAVNLQAREQR